MIKKLRVDYRLVHGQVAISWSRALGVDCILVANDEVAKDEMRQSMLRISKPQGIKLVIKSMEDSIKAIKSGVTDKYKLFIVVNNVKDVERLTDAVPEINDVNLGVLPAVEGSRALSKAINVTADDTETLKHLLSKGIRMEIQQVPTETAVKVTEKLLESEKGERDMLTKALLVGLILGLCKMEYFFGYCMICRPIVISTLTGLVLGDPVQGVILGSVLELMFIGSFPIGAAVSPDYGSAGAICTAFAIITTGGKAVATTLAVPIALLGGFIFIGCKLMNAAFGQVMMKKIEKDNTRAAGRIYLFGAFFTSFVVYFLYGFLSIYAGSTAVQAAVNAIPKVVINGLASAANLLPAIGFALLLKMIISKKMAPYFFVGFMLAAYLKLPTIAVTLFAVMMVLIILSNQKNTPETAEAYGGDENEF